MSIISKGIVKLRSELFPFNHINNDHTILDETKNFIMGNRVTALSDVQSGARPTDDISIEFDFPPKFAVLSFRGYFTDHNEILHTSRQLHGRDVYKVSLWFVERILN